MKQTSLKAQLVTYVSSTFGITCIFLVLVIFYNRYLNQKQNLEIESNKLIVTAQKQTEQIIPGILVAEEYGSIELQLQKIKSFENLSDIHFIKKDDIKINPYLKCNKKTSYDYICTKIWDGELSTATEIRISNELLGYLVKTKKILIADSQEILPISILFSGIAIVFLGLIISILLFIERHVRMPLLNLNKTLAPVLDSDTTNTEISHFSVKELQIVGTQVREIVKKYEEKKANAILSQVASQVSHDIRSPLASLNAVMGQLKDIPEHHRLIIRSSVNRITDIANTLLQKSKEQKKQSNANQTSGGGETPLKLRVDLLPAIVDTLVSEKRVQFRDKIGIDIEADFQDSYGAFANIDPNELKRVLSNTVNNSIEAFLENKGRVTIAVKNYKNEVAIIVKDNGKGIPSHILEKLGQMGVTHGKEGTQSGSGLGIYHAKISVESFGGKFIITSTEGKGTTIKMTFPAVTAPIWFVDKLNLTSQMQIISLDDDLSIHGIWKGRFQSLKINEQNIEHLIFTSCLEFKDWNKTKSNYTNSANSVAQNIRLYLIDYELLSQNQTGLDIIEELGIGANSILVTSRYEEAPIRERCEKLGVKMIPKGMANLIPIQIERLNKNYDLILIDDDELIRLTWETNFNSRGKKIKTFKDIDSFKLEMESIPKETVIYIDSTLGNDVKGEEFAKVLFEDYQFKTIYLATGYEPEHFEGMTWLKAIVSKNPPENI